MVQSHQFDEVVKFDYEIDDEDSVEVEWAPISSIKPLSAFKQLLEAVSESSPEPPGEFAEEELPTVPGHDNKAAPATATGRTKRTLPRAVTAPGGLRTADPPEGHMSDTASDTEAGAESPGVCLELMCNLQNPCDLSLSVCSNCKNLHSTCTTRMAAEKLAWKRWDACWLGEVVCSCCLKMHQHRLVGPTSRQNDIWKS